MSSENPTSPFLPNPIQHEPDFQDFIEFREIKPEDFYIIERLSSFPKDVFIEFHNFFNLNKDKSAIELKRQLDDTSQDKTERREFLNLLHDFATKYDWTACYNLIRIFERRKN